MIVIILPYAAAAVGSEGIHIHNVLIILNSDGIGGGERGWQKKIILFTNYRLGMDFLAPVYV